MSALLYQLYTVLSEGLKSLAAKSRYAGVLADGEGQSPVTWRLGTWGFGVPCPAGHRRSRRCSEGFQSLGTACLETVLEKGFHVTLSGEAYPMCSDDFYVDDTDSDDDESYASSAWENTSERPENSAFDTALANLFAASLEAGKPPPHLRPLLGLVHWQPAAYPGADTQVEALKRGRDFGKKKPKRASPAQTRVACFEARETESKEAVLAHECLRLLRQEGKTDAVLIQYQGQWYGFVAEQFPALESHLEIEAQRRDTEANEARRQELILGAGALDEFLGMPVRVSQGLPTVSGIRGSNMGCNQSRAVSVLTPGFTRGYLYQETRLTLREVLTVLSERTDYDGIQFNTTATGDSCLHSVGPNFAGAALQGRDVRRPPRCPAEAICLFDFAHYLTRWSATMQGYEREEVEKALEGARFLLGSIPPDRDALPRESVLSFLGAFYLRCLPEYATRRWLERFIRRCERALAARWRVGVF
jgi:hypothetical protein